MSFDIVVPTLEEMQSTPDADPGSTNLAAAKSAKLSEITCKTESIIEQGFEYPPASGNQFSLKLRNIVNGVALYIARDNFPYDAPGIPWQMSNGSYYFFSSAADVAGWWGTGIGFVLTVYGTGVPLVSAVLAASTIAEVHAIVDPRI